MRASETLLLNQILRRPCEDPLNSSRAAELGCPNSLVEMASLANGVENGRADHEGSSHYLEGLLHSNSSFVASSAIPAGLPEVQAHRKGTSMSLSFEPTEVPWWRQELPPTSLMLADCIRWQQLYKKLSPRAINFVETVYCKAAVAKFVLHANLSEETGLPDLQSTEEVLEAIGEMGQIATKEKKEVLQLARSLMQLATFVKDLQAVEAPKHILEPLLLTPDIICELHSTLLKGIHQRAGAYREGHAFGGSPNGGVHFYQNPDSIQSLLLSACDLYNCNLERIAQEPEDATPQLFRLAAVSFVQFVTIHPFSDGNGRLARILASHVLRFISPFPVTPFADGTSSTRNVFFHSIIAAHQDFAGSSLSLGLHHHEI